MKINRLLVVLVCAGALCLSSIHAAVTSTTTDSSTTTGASKKMDATAALQKLKDFFTNIKQSLEDMLKSTNYGESQKFEIAEDITIKGTPAKVGLLYDFGFKGSGIDDPLFPIESGFPAIDAKIVPETIAMPGPIPSIPTSGVIALVTKVPAAKEMFDYLLHVRPDTVFFLKLMFLLNTLYRDKAMSAKEKLEFLGTELNFLIARLMYSIDEDATRKLQNKTSKDPIDPKGPVVYYHGPAALIKRLANVLHLTPVLDDLKQDVPQIEYKEFQAKNDRETHGKDRFGGKGANYYALQLGNIFLINHAFNKQTQALNDFLSKDFDNYTKDMDFMDRQDTILALTSHLADIERGAPEKDKDAVLKDRATKFKNLLDVATTKLKDAQFDDTQIKQVQTLYDPINNYLAGTTKEILVQAAKSDTPEVIITQMVRVPLLDYLDLKSGSLMDILKYKFSGDPNYVYSGWKKIGYTQVFKIGFALGFRVLRDLSKAANAFYATAEGKQLFTDLSAQPAAALKVAQAAAKDAKTQLESAKTPDNQAAYDAAFAEFLRKQRDFYKAKAQFKSKAMEFVFDRVKEKDSMGKDVVMHESVLDFLKREAGNLFKRTQHFDVFKAAINNFLSILGLDLETFMPSIKEEAEQEETVEDKALSQDVTAAEPTF